jgi:hypothetical protein
MPKILSSARLFVLVDGHKKEKTTIRQGDWAEIDFVNKLISFKRPAKDNGYLQPILSDRGDDKIKISGDPLNIISIIAQIIGVDIKRVATEIKNKQLISLHIELV